MTTPTNISITTDLYSDDWIWSVTVGEGDGALFGEGRARGPHQASEMAVQARDRLLLNHKEAETHYRNGHDKEIVVRKVHHEYKGLDIEALWVQWYTGDAFTYVRNIDMFRLVEIIERTGSSLHHLDNVIRSF